MAKYHVVKFVEENSVSVVPFSWVEGEWGAETCAWPPLRGPKKIEDFVKASRVPEPSWTRVRVSVMKTTDSYDKAIRYEEKALLTSDLATDAEEVEMKNLKKRKRSKPYRGDTSTDEDDDRQLPLPPLPKIRRQSQGQSSMERVCSPPQMPLGISNYEKINCSFSSPNIAAEKVKEESFQKKVLRMMESMQEDIRQIKENIKISRGPLPTLPPSCPQLPCEHPENLVELDILLQDENMFSNICNFLSTIGGSCIKDCTKRVLGKIVSNSLSLKYNWKGTRGVKLAFSSFTYVNKLIFGAVRSNHMCAAATEVEVQDIIKKWLMHAKDRDGGRNIRAYLNASNQELA